jgi:hypothetical protein
MWENDIYEKKICKWIELNFYLYDTAQETSFFFLCEKWFEMGSAVWRAVGRQSNCGVSVQRGSMNNLYRPQKWNRTEFPVEKKRNSCNFSARIS